MKLWIPTELFQPVGVAVLAERIARTRQSLRRNPYFEGAQSDHFDGRIFFNPGGTAPGPLIDLLKWQLGGGRAKWPAR